MSILLIDQPPSAPVTDAATSWTPVVDSFKFNNLGVSNPVDYDFSGDTVKKGVQINIGGSNYQVTADEPITGTTSIYVKITASGSTATAAYVSDLTGVAWNDTYNFYADSSGNAYLFSEALSGVSDPKTIIGKFAEDAHVKLLTVAGNITQSTGVTSLKATTINGYGYVNQESDTSSSGIKMLNSKSTGSLRLWEDVNDISRLDGDLNGTNEIALNGAGGGAVLINTVATNGTDALQVAGSIYASGGLTASTGYFSSLLTASRSISTATYVEALVLSNGNSSNVGQRKGISSYENYIGYAGYVENGRIEFQKGSNASGWGILNFYTAKEGVLGKALTLNQEGDATFSGDISATGALTCATIDTGNGATEIYDMNQDLRTDDAVTFAGITSSLDVTVGRDLYLSFTKASGGTELKKKAAVSFVSGDTQGEIHSAIVSEFNPVANNSYATVGQVGTAKASYFLYIGTVVTFYTAAGSSILQVTIGSSSTVSVNGFIEGIKA